MIEIECPNCSSIGKMSLAQMMFEGPYRCWKCRTLYSIVIANQKVQSLTPLSEEDFATWQVEQKMRKRDSD